MLTRPLLSFELSCTCMHIWMEMVKCALAALGKETTLDKTSISSNSQSSLNHFCSSVYLKIKFVVDIMLEQE